ncbi:NUDIX hydrolase, partial [Streptomyces sp. ZEA17I]
KPAALHRAGRATTLHPPLLRPQPADAPLSRPEGRTP